MSEVAFKENRNKYIKELHSDNLYRQDIKLYEWGVI